MLQVTLLWSHRRNIRNPAWRKGNVAVAVAAADAAAAAQAAAVVAKIASDTAALQCVLLWDRRDIVVEYGSGVTTFDVKTPGDFQLVTTHGIDDADLGWFKDSNIASLAPTNWGRTAHGKFGMTWQLHGRAPSLIVHIIKLQKGGVLARNGSIPVGSVLLSVDGEVTANMSAKQLIEVVTRGSSLSFAVPELAHNIFPEVDHVAGAPGKRFYETCTGRVLTPCLWGARTLVWWGSLSHLVPARQLERLYIVYKPKFWWFELVLVAYRMVVVGLLGLIAPDRSISISLLVTIQLVFIALLLTVSPYQRKSDGTLALAMHFGVLLWTVLTMSVPDEHNETALSVVYFALLFGIPAFTLYSACSDVCFTQVKDNPSNRESNDLEELRAERMARVKRCVVQLSVYDRTQQSPLNMGSGVLLENGDVLTAAHNLLDMAWMSHDPTYPHVDRPLLVPSASSDRTVLVAQFCGNEEPPRWAYEARVLTPAVLLRQTHITNDSLLDLAVLKLTHEVTCSPTHSRGADHFNLDLPAQERTIEITQRSVMAQENISRLPFLKCNIRAVDTGDQVTVVGYAAAAGKHLFVSANETAIEIERDYLHTKAFIHSGSSGGPVVDEFGDIVSVVSRGGGVQTSDLVVVPPGKSQPQTIRVLMDDDVPQPAQTRLVRMLTEEHFIGSNKRSQNKSKHLDGNVDGGGREDESKGGDGDGSGNGNGTDGIINMDGDGGLDERKGGDGDGAGAGAGDGDGSGTNGIIISVHYKQSAAV